MTRSWRFTDINYQTAGKEEKEQLFLAYGDLLNSFDPGAVMKVTLLNRAVRRADVENSRLLQERGTPEDRYRRELNQIMLRGSESGTGIHRERILTMSVFKKSFDEARSSFDRAESILCARFSALGSEMTPLNLSERLQLLHDFYRDSEEPFFWDGSREMQLGHGPLDRVVPDGVEKHADCLRLGDRWARVFYLKDYANFLRDSLLTRLCDRTGDLACSVDVYQVPTDEAVREIERRLLGVETNITGWQRRQNAGSNFSAVVPYEMEQQRQESREFLEDLSARDQRMMMGLLTLAVTADSREELESKTEAVQTLAREYRCQLSVLRFQQLEGLATALPIGVRKVPALRTFTTESLSALMPFRVREIQDEGGLYFGENAISRNPIFLNREKLLNPSGFLLGVPGSGKSFCAKQMIAQVLLGSDDDLLLCDPEGEYAPLVQALEKDASIVHIAAGGADRLNAMTMVEGYGEDHPLGMKSEFILSLVEQIDPAGVGARQKSILDRCLAHVFSECKDTGKVPTLCLLYEKLLTQPEKEAGDLALALELYTKGSLELFGKESNVDLSKRVIVFDLHGLGAQLKPTGLLMVTDTMLNRVTLNWKAGKRTHVFLDEFHVVFENACSAQFFASAWRQFRKRNVFPTAMTQNVEYLLSDVKASTMLSNSELILMLNQAASDRERLASLLQISDEQLHYITGSAPGSGLLRCGSALVPFVSRFPKESELYRLMTTRPSEQFPPEKETKETKKKPGRRRAGQKTVAKATGV